MDPIAALHQRDRRESAVHAKRPRKKPPKRLRMQCLTAEGNPVDLSEHLRRRPVFLAGAGPSLNEIDLSLLSRRGVVSMAMNNTWSVFRPSMWICTDGPERFCDKGWLDPGIMKFCPVANRTKTLRRKEGSEFRHLALRPLDCPSTFFYSRSEHFDPDRYLTEPVANWGNRKATKDALGLHGCRTVMLAALKMLYWMGAGDVYLIGTDFRMSETHKYAFAQERPAAAIQNNTCTYGATVMRLKTVLPAMEAAGMRLRCCVKDSMLCNIMPHVPFEDAVAEASADCEVGFDTEGWYG